MKTHFKTRHFKARHFRACHWNGGGEDGGAMAVTARAKHLKRFATVEHRIRSATATNKEKTC